MLSDVEYYWSDALGIIRHKLYKQRSAKVRAEALMRTCEILRRPGARQNPGHYVWEEDGI